MSSRILPEFDLLLPGSVSEAVGMLAENGGQTAILAGGTDLLISMKTGYSPANVLSLADVPDLDFLNYDDASGLRLGAMTTLAQVVESDLVKEKYPALWQSAYVNGTPQTRNIATVLGNIMRASPAGDCCCAVLAHGASVVLEGPEGKREIGIDDFWLDYRVTARKPEELAVGLKLAPVNGGSKSAFTALTRTYQDLAKINAAAGLQLDGDIVKDARLAMGAVAPVPLRLKKCEEMLIGAQVSGQMLENKGRAGEAQCTWQGCFAKEGLLDSLSRQVASQINPIDDVRSTAEYRKEVAGVLVRRVIYDALAG